MADTLDALLGLDNNDDASTRALAKQLRDQQAYARYFSETANPDVNKTSARELVDIQDNAQRLGNRRYKIGRDKVTDARNLRTDEFSEMDKNRSAGLAQSKFQQLKDQYGDTRANREELEAWLDADGNPFNAFRDASGKYFRPDGTPANMTGAQRDPNAVTNKGYIPADRKSGVREIKIKVDGVDYIFDKDTRELIHPATGAVVTDPDIIAKATRSAAEAEREKAFRIEEGKGAGEALTDDIKAWNARGDSVDSYRSILTLLQSDEANTGQVYKQLPTFKAATAALESLTENLTLGALDEHQLKPVSDIDIKVLRNSVLPADLQAEDLAVWVAHKIEATERYMEYEDLILRWKSENPGRRMSRAQKVQFDEKRDEILYANNFDPFDPLGGVGGGAGGGQDAPLPVEEGYEFKRSADGTLMRRKVGG